MGERLARSVSKVEGGSAAVAAAAQVEQLQGRARSWSGGELVRSLSSVETRNYTETRASRLFPCEYRSTSLLIDKASTKTPASILVSAL